MAKLILASSSPRRKEVLTTLGLDFEAFAPEVDESSADHLPAAQRVIALARLKAGGAAALIPLSPGEECLILAADTLVALDPLPSPLPRGIALDGVLGKAKDRDEARAMIDALAGRPHAVHTGLALLSLPSRRLETALSTSRVDFAPMSNEEIEAYLDYGDWEGVAGAYRIQGRAALHIRTIEGSWSGIVGLPIHELYVMLGRSGLHL